MAQLKTVSKQEPCPICGKPDYCFWKEREKEPGLYNLYCNRSSGVKGNIVTGCDGKEYVTIIETETATVFEELHQREKRTQRKVTGEKTEYQPRTLTVLDSVVPLPHQDLDKIYRCLMKKLPLYKFHAQYLLKEGWNMDLIKANNICSFPAEKVNKLPHSLRNIKTRETLAQEIMDELSLKSLAGVPGAYVTKKGKWTFHGKSGIIFPVYDLDGLIYRLRIRMDYMDLPIPIREDKDGFFYMDHEERVTVSMSGPYKIINTQKVFIDFSSHKGKYRNFSSYKENADAYKSGFLENVFNKGCEAKNNILYMVGGSNNLSVWWIIEGEKKAIFSNKVISQPFIALPGVNNFKLLDIPEHGKTPLDAIKQKGAKIMIVAYDADCATNPAVMKCLNNLAELLSKNDFCVFIAIWDQKDGKGLDDLLGNGKVPSFIEYEGNGKGIG